ncbi:TIGR01777 family oxidoreductase [Specibacter cremeus]|uniref:TIGR01777 family oxidoreductase n=1 Tax=Specibacter cremeus TaxID=1629051 RepID=UPI000F76ACD3|nr:TIGR01777 family oxidoreductase [Specibacter cremeus]
MPTFTYTAALPYPRARVFEWFTRPGALVRLNPPFAGSVVREPSRGIEPGSTAVVGVAAPGRLGLWLGSTAASATGLLPRSLRGLDILRPEVHWEALHTELVPGESFTDVMTGGPLTSWTHRHLFTDGTGSGATAASTIITDRIDYEIPRLADNPLTRRRFETELGRFFAFRERQLHDDLDFHAAHAVGPRTVVVAGASGLIGTQVCALLGGGGHRVLRLVRRPPRMPDEISWDPAAGVLDDAALADCDAVVNLAGHPIGGRFTPHTKDLILHSRVDSTALLAAALARLSVDGRARTLVNASAVGYYGSRPHGAVGGAAQRHATPLTEDAPAGTDFLARVCQAWEGACAVASDAGVRVVNVRTGLVLTPAGGVLQRLLPLFVAWLGGPVGKDQWQSWIGIDDIAGIYAHAVLNDAVAGPVNAVAPTPVTADRLAKAVARAVHRPAVLKVPDFGPRLLLGKQGAQELALADQRISSARIEGTGYAFRDSTVEAALRHVLGSR